MAVSELLIIFNLLTVVSSVVINMTLEGKYIVLEIKMIPHKLAIFTAGPPGSDAHYPTRPSFGKWV